MSESFSGIMDVLGNTVRRRILRKLSEGPDYALRISQELQLGQQLVAKHIKILEDAGFVVPVWEDSNRGARKKLYSIDKFYSVRVDFSPSLYTESLVLFDDEKEWIESSKLFDDMEDRLHVILDSLKGTEQLNPLNVIISEIDSELDMLERRRAELLFIRDKVKRRTSESMDNIDRRERQLLHHIIERGPSSIDDISQGLLIREDSVRAIIRELIKKDLISERNKKIEIHT